MRREAHRQLQPERLRVDLRELAQLQALKRAAVSGLLRRWAPVQAPVPEHPNREFAVRVVRPTERAHAHRSVYCWIGDGMRSVFSLQCEAIQGDVGHSAAGIFNSGKVENGSRWIALSLENVTGSVGPMAP